MNRSLPKVTIANTALCVLYSHSVDSLRPTCFWTLCGAAFVLLDTKNRDPRIVPMHSRLRICAHYVMPTRFITSYHSKSHARQ